MSDRIIKFRDKCAITGQWVYGYYVLEKGDINTIITFDGIKLLIISDTKGQYIGLKDKNGKEIYKIECIIKNVYENKELLKEAK